MSETTLTHEWDLQAKLASFPEDYHFNIIYNLMAVASCEDSSLEERCEAAAKAQIIFDERFGPFHWMQRHCYNGECATCNAHPKCPWGDEDCDPEAS